MRLDLGTTGVDPRHDEIIAFAIVPFHYDGERRSVAAWEALHRKRWRKIEAAWRVFDQNRQELAKCARPTPPAKGESGVRSACPRQGAPCPGGRVLDGDRPFCEKAQGAQPLGVHLGRRLELTMGRAKP